MASDAESPEKLREAFAKARLEQDRQKQLAAGKIKLSADAGKFKLAHGLLVGLFITIAALHVAGIFLFTKGFLLTRLVLENKSECDVSPTPEGITRTGEGCWHKKSFDKAVIIVVDALRFDFTVPYDGPSPQPFHNAFTTPYEIASKHPENAVLLPFIADPPTTTLQRLKGLTTGTLPTFIDAGSNFAGTAIEEDNLIDQLRKQGKRISLLGDDTWTALFPTQFEPGITHHYDSLNVWDLHTVDNGVNEHVFPLLDKANSSRWDVLIGHYLGVDHAGHRYGPGHPAMTAKLKQMDKSIKEIAERIDEDTLLVVMGDHGMDPKGDHGGESWEELEAAIWMYSKKPFFGRLPPELLPKEGRRSVQQIDLVPSLALLLGIPIPYNNLGKPIAEAFLGSKSDTWENLALASRTTAHQIARYQDEYAVAQKTTVDQTSFPVALYDEAVNFWQQEVAKLESSRDWRLIYEMFILYQHANLKECKNKWAEFNLGSMAAGVLVLLCSVAVLAILGRGLSGDTTELTAVLIQKTATGMGCGVAFTALTSNLIPWGLPRAYISIIGASIGSTLGFSFGAASARIRLQSILPEDIWGFASLLFTIVHAILFGSNSFTIWEDQILTFLISTFGVISLIYAQRNEDQVRRALGVYHSIAFLVLGRLAATSRLCREEQMPFCRSTFYASATSSVSSVSSLTLLAATALFFPSIIKSFYKGTRSYEGPALFWIGIIFRVSLIFTAVYWFMDSADNGEWFDIDEATLKASKTMVSQVVLIIGVVAGTIGFAWSQVCANVEIVRPDDLKPVSKQPDTGVKQGDTVIVLGYANMHGSRYFLLVAGWAIVLILVQKPLGGVSMAILLWQILNLAEMIDINDLRESAIGPVVLGLLGYSHFFSTGHQATLQAIQWESAFIPFKTIVYPWSPLLVVANTVGPQIMAALAVPLLVLWKLPPKSQGALSAVGSASATHLLYHSVITLSSVFCAGHLRRHLMLYRIFSPRFMLGAVAMLTVDFALILLGLVGVRWNFMAIADVFGFVY